MFLDNYGFLDAFIEFFIKESIKLLVVNKNINSYIKTKKNINDIFNKKQDFINIQLYSRAFINNVKYDKYDNAFNTYYNYSRRMDNLNIIKNIIAKITHINDDITNLLINNNIILPNIYDFYIDINKLYYIFASKIIFERDIAESNINYGINLFNMNRKLLLNDYKNLNNKIVKLRHFCSSNYY